MNPTSFLNKKGGGQQKPSTLKSIQKPVKPLTFWQWCQGIGAIVVVILAIVLAIVLYNAVSPYFGLIGKFLLIVAGIAVVSVVAIGIYFLFGMVHARVEAARNKARTLDPGGWYKDDKKRLVGLPAVKDQVQVIKPHQPTMALPQKSSMLETLKKKSEPVFDAGPARPVAQPVSSLPSKSMIEETGISQSVPVKPLMNTQVVPETIQNPVPPDVQVEDDDEEDERNEPSEDEYEVLNKKSIIEQLNKMQFPEAPTLKSFQADLTTYLATGKMIFGYVLDGTVKAKQLIGTMKEAYSILVAGLPGRGKSTLLFYLITQFIGMRAEIWIFDPHAQLIELAREKIFNYEHDMDTMFVKTLLILDIFKKRQKEYTECKMRGEEYKAKPFLFVIDEMPVLADEEKDYQNAAKAEGIPFYSIKKLLKKIVNEGRKYYMYAIVAGQSFPATVLPTIVRDNFTTKYAFFTEPRQAQMIGLSAEARKVLLPKLRPLETKGLCIATIPGLLEKETIIDIPDTTIDDMKIMIAYAKGKVVDADPHQKNASLPPTVSRPIRRSIQLQPVVVKEEDDNPFVDVPGIDRPILKDMIDDLDKAIHVEGVSNRTDLYRYMPDGFKNREVARKTINAICDWKGWLKQDRVVIVPERKDDQADPEDETKRF